jgi:pyroglutamyl-peptidase
VSLLCFEKEQDAAHAMASSRTSSPASQGQKNGADIRFVVTGFGPFADSLENPSMITANNLMAHLKEHNEKLASKTTTMVLEVSVEAVKKRLDELEQELRTSTASQEGTTVVLLHLGVNYLGLGFQLEQCAYNDATFRIPDVKGYHPDKELIVEKLEWAQPLSTSLPVSEICQQLQEKYDCVGCLKEERERPKKNAKKEQKDGEQKEGDSARKNASFPSAIKVFTSTDPGRYVCNYTYCYSLNKYCSSDGGKFHSLFLHVPPVQVISQEDQIKFVMELMECIHDKLCVQ